MFPLRRGAGERVGRIAKQWEGEVVLLTYEIFRSQTSRPTSPSPRKRGSPPSPPAMTRAERASDAMCEGDSRRLRAAPVETTECLTELSNVVAYVCRPSRPEDRQHGLL